MTQYPTLHMMIDGQKVSGGGRRTHAVINPATGETLGELPLADPADLDRALDVAAQGFKLWRKSTPPMIWPAWPRWKKARPSARRRWS
jgi:succinate-semialdehyde dehydrogenase/glutarate-semialdehyde dehydrogenase